MTTTHKIWHYEHESGPLGTDLRVYVRTAFNVPKVADIVSPTLYHVAGRLTRINRARYERWHPNHALYVVAPVGEIPPDRFRVFTISEDDPR